MLDNIKSGDTVQLLPLKEIIRRINESKTTEEWMSKSAAYAYTEMFEVEYIRQMCGTRQSVKDPHYDDYDGHQRLTLRDCHRLFFDWMFEEYYNDERGVDVPDIQSAEEISILFEGAM